jgi:hypothetical protein
MKITNVVPENKKKMRTFIVMKRYECKILIIANYPVLVFLVYVFWYRL